MALPSSSSGGRPPYNRDFRRNNDPYAAIRRNIMRGLSVPAGILVAPGVNGHAPDLDQPAKVDTEGAKKLLAEAGYPGGFEVRFS